MTLVASRSKMALMVDECHFPPLGLGRLSEFIPAAMVMYSRALAILPISKVFFRGMLGSELHRHGHVAIIGGSVPQLSDGVIPPAYKGVVVQ